MTAAASTLIPGFARSGFLHVQWRHFQNGPFKRLKNNANGRICGESNSFCLLRKKKRGGPNDD